MRRATVISLVGHGAIIAWALFSFARPLEKLEGESFPVDVLTASDFSKIAAGDLKAPISETPKQIVDKIAEPTPPPDDPTASVDKKTVTASTEQTNPEPSPPTPEVKPVAAPPEAKAETKTPEKKEPDQKVDPIAETLKKEEAKKPEQKAEVKPQPVKKPEPQQSKLDLRQVRDAIDKRKATRVALAGTELNQVVSRGAPKGTAAELSADEMSQIGRHIRNNWNKPRNWDRQRIKIDIDIEFNIDGTFAKPPVVTTRGSGPLYDAVKASAIQALNKSVPFYFLKPARYEHWKNVPIVFDTIDMDQ